MRVYSRYMSTCIKCGSNETDARWHACPPSFPGYVSECTLDMGNREEVMHLVCSHCGYAWHELPIDAEVDELDLT